MIQASVGAGGLNKKVDVAKIQNILNNYIESQCIYVLAPLVVDGCCGRKTVACLVDFQSKVVGMARPDGRVDVNGNTLRMLLNYETQAKLLLFKQASGYSPSLPVKEMKKRPNPPNTHVFTTASTQVDPRQLKTRSAIAEVFGAITKEKQWPKKSQFLKKYTIPKSISSHKDYNWINTYDPRKRKLTSFWCNKAMHEFLDKALDNVKSAGVIAELTEFGGSHAIRATRGTMNWSAHSWALAIDINMTGNGLGQTPVISKALADCFKNAGFGWGGDYTSRKDGMHFTIAGFDMPSKI